MKFCVICQFSAKLFNLASCFLLLTSLFLISPVYSNPILIVPNPYKPNDGNNETGKPYNPADPTSGIIFTNIPSGTTIRIFDVRGKQVRKISINTAGNFQWNVFDDKSNPVPSGSYTVIIRTTTQKLRKRLIIIK
ncbi:MAG: T9SS type A sorting domain-containing protein [Candidatus Hydrogenedentota bacterium]